MSVWQGDERGRGVKGVRYQASPKFMAPMHSGLTRMPAVGESRRWRPKRLLGCGAGSMGAMVAGRGR